MKNIILQILKESVYVKNKSISNNIDKIIQGAGLFSKCFCSGHKLLIFGNGGSAADAQHLAAEFVNRFQIERQPLAAIALTTDTSIITSIGNDYHFNDIFAKQISALGNTGDIVLAISTSGNSENIIKAVCTAKKKKIFTMGMTGQGGRLLKCADLTLTVESDSVPRIQETHITMGHILCELVDQTLFVNKSVS